MVLHQVLLLFLFFILALDKYSRNYKIQLISSQLILLPYMRRKEKSDIKKPSQEGFFIIKFILRVIFEDSQGCCIYPYPHVCHHSSIQQNAL